MFLENQAYRQFGLGLWKRRTMIKLRINRDGTKSYQVRVKDRFGKRYPAETFEKKVDAEKRERELKSKADSGGRHLRSIRRT